jgi:hypothetical protein
MKHWNRYFVLVLGGAMALWIASHFLAHITA